MSGLNPDWLSRIGQLDDELVSSEDLVVLSPCKEQRRRLTWKERGKIKMSKYGTDKSELD